MATRTRLVILSEQRLTREALCACFERLPDVEVVGSSTPRRLLTLCGLRQPHVALIDAGALDAARLEEFTDLHADLPGTAIVVTYASTTVPVPTLRGTGTALVPGSWGLPALVVAVRRQAAAVRHAAPSAPVLTDRDLAVVALLGSGGNTAEIAARLGVSPRAVEGRKRRVYAKLGVGSLADAVSRAMSLGLVETTEPGHAQALPHRPPPGAPTVLLLGPDGAARDAVTGVLAGHGWAHRDLGDAGLREARTAGQDLGPDDGAVVAVLVDPGPSVRDAGADPELPVVVVRSLAPEPDEVADGLRQGASAVLAAEQAGRGLTTVVALAADGYAVLPRDLLTEMVGVPTGEDPLRPESEVPLLTRREQQILELIVAGRTVRQTARRLGIAPKTVENTQTRLFAKLGARNRAQALTEAFRLGLIDPC